MRLVDLEAAPPLRQDHSTLVICDSEPVFARGLAKLLEGEGHEFQVLEVATSRVRLEEVVRRSGPDLSWALSGASRFL